MHNLIEKYVKTLTKEQVNNFAQQKNIFLSEEELEFTFLFIKKNWKTVIGNPSLLNFEMYKSHYSPENFAKIKKLAIEYYQKYGSYL